MALPATRVHKLLDAKSLGKVITVVLLSSRQFSGMHFSPDAGHHKCFLAGG